MNTERLNQAESLAPIVSALEAHLAELDLLGAHIAAAHVDAAIQQLRMESAAMALP